MALCLLIFLISIAVAMIGWGLWQRDRIYQFPTLAGVAWLGYITAQAVGVYNNPRSVPSGVLNDRGLELALLMSCLCALASFVGYLHGGRLRPAATKPMSYSLERLFLGGLLLYVAAFCSFHLLAQLAGGYFKYFSTEGAYTLYWRGLPVIYTFFVRLIYPGILLCLVAALYSRSLVKWAAVGIGCLIPVANIIFLGRRQNAIVLMLIIAVTIFLIRRWAPPRPISAIAMVLGALMVVIAPAYRAHSQLGANYRGLRNIDVKGDVMDRLEGSKTWVFENAVVQIAAVRRAGEYAMGAGIYNRTVQSMVPRAIVGRELKEQLIISAPDHRDLTWRYYRWKTKYGTYSTGVCDAFREFWFFGALVFYVIGFAFRRLWERASVQDSLPAKLFYVTTCVFAMTSVVNNVGYIPAQLFFLIAFLYPIICLSRVSGQSRPVTFSPSHQRHATHPALAT